MHSLFQSLNTRSGFDGRLSFLCTSRGSSLHGTEERDMMLRDIVRFSVGKMEVLLSVPVPPGGA